MLPSFVQLLSWLLLALLWSGWGSCADFWGRVSRTGNELDNCFWGIGVAAFEPPATLTDPASRWNACPHFWCLLMRIPEAVLEKTIHFLPSLRLTSLSVPCSSWPICFPCPKTARNKPQVAPWLAWSSREAAERYFLTCYVLVLVSPWVAKVILRAGIQLQVTVSRLTQIKEMLKR